MHTSMAFAACNGDYTFPLDWEYENWFNTSLLFQPQLLDLNQEPTAFQIEEKQACVLGCKVVQRIPL